MIENEKDEITFTSTRKGAPKTFKISNATIKDIEGSSINLDVKYNSEYLDDFSEQLKNHVINLGEEFNQELYIKEGFELARLCDGGKENFGLKMQSILEETQHIFNGNDNTKTLIKAKMKSSLERATELNKNELDASSLSIIKQSEILQEDFREKITVEKNRLQSKQEDFNKANSELDKIKFEINSIIITVIDDPETVKTSLVPFQR
jgi:hypothetical protein